MSRNVPSLDEILAQKGVKQTQPTKTRFFTKAQREAKLDRPPDKPGIVNSGSGRITKPSKAVSNAKRPREQQSSKKPIKRDAQSTKNTQRRFNWDENEDTLADYDPIVPTTDHDSTKFDTHWSEKPLQEMTQRDWRIVNEDYNISSTGTEHPLRNWREAQANTEIVDQIGRLGYQEPTPVQRAAIPIGLAAKDVIGIAETGSGKTMAYIVPLLNYVSKLPGAGDFEGPYGLVMVPTRELALQVEKEFEKFYRAVRFKVVSLIGGHSYEENVEQLKNGAEIIIATPGRLIDCLDQKLVHLDKCYFLVMDEADRMVDMGFEEQVTKVLKALPPGDTNPYYFGQGTPQRTTMMFTATMPQAINEIAKSYLKDPATVIIGEIGSAVDSVSQVAIQVSDDDEKRQVALLRAIERRQRRTPAIVFANYKKTCEILGKSLSDHGYRPVVMHGSRSQEQREAAIEDIRNGHADILVATDVAGRGIDIANVSLVVNYQLPKTIDEYTHRIGRTGRAGKRGLAISFWNEQVDEPVLPDLYKMIEKSPVSRVPEDLAETVHSINT